MEAREIKRSFTKRYIIAISIIAALSSMAFIFQPMANRIAELFREVNYH